MNITIVICGITAITSFLAFRNHSLFDELIFWPYRIWRNNEWHRIISSGFIHGNDTHLIFNMIALYSFGTYVESSFVQIFQNKGLTLYVVMYFSAIAIADVYQLFTRKNDYSYRSLGASGGVSAIVFASILLNPFGKILLFFILPIPAYIFGPLYLIYCTYAARRGGDNIDHTAHFTGSIFGFIFPIIFAPHLLTEFIQMLRSGL
jgi:membrane associated rhomboid family serine protease